MHLIFLPFKGPVGFPGDPGPPGEPGVAVSSFGQTYYKAVVKFISSTNKIGWHWRCKELFQPHTLCSLQGTDGEPGEKGEDGEAGQPVSSFHTILSTAWTAYITVANDSLKGHFLSTEHSALKLS